MSQVYESIEEYGEEKVKKAVREAEIKIVVNCLKNGIPIDLISKSIPTLSLEQIEELQKKLV